MICTTHTLDIHEEHDWQKRENTEEEMYIEIPRLEKLHRGWGVFDRCLLIGRYEIREKRHELVGKFRYNG